LHTAKALVHGNVTSAVHCTCMFIVLNERSHEEATLQYTRLAPVCCLYLTISDGSILLDTILPIVYIVCIFYVNFVSHKDAISF
jgi:hypothetical protein